MLVGIRTRGVPLAEALAAEIERAEGARVPLGTLDITLYRDDLSTVAPKPVVKESRFPEADRRAACWCSATTCSTPAARCAPRSTRWSTSAGRGRCSSRC